MWGMSNMYLHALRSACFPTMAPVLAPLEHLRSRFGVIFGTNVFDANVLLPQLVFPVASCNQLPTARVLLDAWDDKAIYSQRKVIMSSSAECHFPLQHVTVIYQGVWVSTGRLWWHNWKGYSQ